MFTALLIAILIITGAATVVGGGLVLAAARRRELAAAAPHKQLPGAGGSGGLERGFEELRAGDIVQRGDTDYLVEGVIEFDEDGHRWLGARLTDGEHERWLYVGMERMGRRSKRWLEVDPNLEMSGFPPERITVGGTRYSLDKRGTASARTTADVGSLPLHEGLGAESVHRCRWWRYEGAGSATMVVEQWSQEFRTLRGQELGDGELDMMPGS